MSFIPNGQNITKNDAYLRVTYAKMGFLAKATDEFLMHLRSYLFTWIGEIDAEMARRIKQAEIEEENRLQEEMNQETAE